MHSHHRRSSMRSSGHDHVIVLPDVAFNADVTVTTNRDVRTPLTSDAKSTQLVVFVVVNAALQLLYFLYMAPRFFALAQGHPLCSALNLNNNYTEDEEGRSTDYSTNHYGINNARPSVQLVFNYVVDVCGIVVGFNGFLLWWHFVSAAYFREYSIPYYHSSIRPCCLATTSRTWVFIILETIFALFIIIDGFLLVRFNLHILSPTVLAMLAHPDWLLATSHIDGWMMGLILFGIGIFWAGQFLIYYACSCIASDDNCFGYISRSTAPISTKKLLAILPVVLLVVILWAVFVPTGTCGSVASSTLPFHLPTVVSVTTRELVRRQKLQPVIDVSSLLNKKTNIMDASLYPQLKNKKNILLLIGDSMRADWLDRVQSQNTRAWIETPHPNYTCHVFDSHYSNGHSTELGIFSMMYSIWPEITSVRKVEAMKHAASFPLSVLKANGYKLTGFKSGSQSYSYLLGASNPAFFAEDQFDHQYAYDNLSDEQIMRQVRDWKGNWDLAHSTDTANDEHYFILVFLSRSRGLASNFNDPHLYWNALRTLDYSFQLAIDTFGQDIDDGKTAVVITSDHGELLGESGLYGHGRNALDQFWRSELVRIPLIMCLPIASNEAIDKLPTNTSTDWLESHAWSQRKLYLAAERRDNEPPLRITTGIQTTQVDLMPSLFDYMLMAPRMEPRLYSHGKSIFTLNISDLRSASRQDDLLAAQNSEEDLPQECTDESDAVAPMFENINGHDRIALITPFTVSATFYNMDDCLFVSKDYDENRCTPFLTTHVYNMSTTKMITGDMANKLQSSAHTLDCVRARLYWFISHPLAQLPHASTIRVHSLSFTTTPQLHYQGTTYKSDSGLCATVATDTTSTSSTRNYITFSACASATAQQTAIAQLWVPVNGDTYRSVAAPACILTTSAPLTLPGRTGSFTCT